MTKTPIPADEAAFAKLREQARRTAGQGPAPRPTTSAIVQDRKPSAGPKPEASGPKPLADPRPRPAAPESSNERERPARPAVEELEPEEDLHDLFFPVRRK